ncbi:hypothetical protein HID58_058585 [Brassica napus]|uniref:Protein DA1-like domain-containing protein n=1 Tax=Brassica napus TaxID=3708 RepID=A0ABQ7ZQK8_BRANA|nr:hypothetical protein HID58_058585 [Brassica napus]
MDSSSSSSSSSSYGVAHVSHISNPCIFGEAGSSSSSTYRDKKWNLMKWVGKLFKSGSSGGGARTNHHPPQFQEDENMVFPLHPSSLDDRSRGARDKEEFDRAMSLSRADDRRRPHGYGWSMDNNSDFPRPFHGGLNPPSFIPPYEPSYQFRRRQSSLYQEPNPIIRFVSKSLLILNAKFIPTNDAGLIEYRCHPFWNQKYCPSHEYDKTARCCSCERLESWDVRYYTLEDGRSLCLECMETAITDTGDCQPLYHSIRDYYEGMYMKLEQQIPMLLVQREALNDAIVGEKNGYHHMPETRGLCLSEEQTVTSVLKRPRLGAHRLVGMRTQPRKLTRKCEVTAILVLYGLPRLLTGAILAHELMHGWLRLKGYRNLNPEVEEGICQVLSYMWLESEVLSDPLSRNVPSTSSSGATSSSSSSFSNKKGGKSNVEKKLGEFFKHQIAHDASPAYGGGFRSANAAVSKYGLHRTLDHIRFTGTFPL